MMPVRITHERRASGEAAVEEVLGLLIQFVIEVLLQALVYLPFDVPFARKEKTGERTGCGWYLLYLVLGGVFGGLSLLVFPKHLIPLSWMRVLNLLAAPAAAGGAGYAVSAWRRSRRAKTHPWGHFWAGVCFTLAFGAVRLAYAG